MSREVVKKVKNATLYSDGTIRIDNVRASYPHLATPFEGENDDGKKKSTFSVTAMLPKATHKEAKDLLKEVITKMMTENDVKVASDKWFLTDGDQTDKPEYEKHFIVKANETKRPAVRKKNGEIMTQSEIEDTIYGGCYLNIFIRPWYFNGKAKNGKSYPKRVLSNLLAAQFAGDGEPFGDGRISDDDVWEDSDGFDPGSSSDDDL